MASAEGFQGCGRIDVRDGRDFLLCIAKCSVQRIPRLIYTGWRCGISQNMTQALKKGVMVLRIFKYDPALDSQDDNMVKGPGCIMRAWRGMAE